MHTRDRLHPQGGFIFSAGGEDLRIQRPGGGIWWWRSTSRIRSHDWFAEIPKFVDAPPSRRVSGLERDRFARLRGAEPVREFLAALRDADYFDVALDYLDQMATSPLAPATLKESLAYERGLTLMQGARHQKDFSLREKQLDAAQPRSIEFVAQQPNHAMAFSAKSELGNLLVERGNLKMERVKRPTEVQKDKLRADARACTVKPKDVPRPRRGPQSQTRTDPQEHRLRRRTPSGYEVREQMRADFLQAELLSAAVLEESADTMDKSAKEYKETLTKAAKEYGKLYNKYRRRSLAYTPACTRGGPSRTSGTSKKR